MDQTGACSPKFYGLPKIHKRTTPQAHGIMLGLCYLWCSKGISLHSSATGGQVSTPHIKYTGLHGKNQEHYTRTMRMHNIISCYSTPHISISQSSPRPNYNKSQDCKQRLNSQYSTSQNFYGISSTIHIFFSKAVL